MKRIISIILCLCLIFTLAACGSKETTTAETTQTTEQKVFKLVHADVGTEDSAYEIYARYFTKYLEELSGGTWTVEVVSDAIMGSEPDVIVQLKMGQLDGSLITNISYSSVDPDMYFCLLPYTFRTYEEVNAVLDDPTFRELQDASLYEYGNVHAYGAAHMGFRHLMFGTDIGNGSTEPLTVDAVQGKKIRVTETPITVGVFNQMGCVPTAMTSAEMITALQQGTVDGCTYSILPANSYSLQKGIVKSILKTYHYYVYAFMAYSDNFWNSLSTEEQAWFKEASERAGVDQRAEVEEYEQTCLEKFNSEEGVQIYEADLDSFIEKTAPAYDKFRDQIDPEIMDCVEGILESLR